MASLAKMQKLEVPEETPELFKKSELTDITLVVEGKELNFAKYPLMTGSSVFTTMINNSKDKSRLVLEDVSYKDMIKYLECQHPKALGVITDDNLEVVAMLAQRFKHDGFLHRCEEYIIDRFNQPSGCMYPNFFLHLKVADKCNMKKAIQVGVSSETVAKTYFGYINTYPVIPGYEKNDNFTQLSAETKNQILSTRLKNAEREIKTLEKEIKTLKSTKHKS